MYYGIDTLGRLTGLPFVLGIKPYATMLVFGLMLKFNLVTDNFFLRPQFDVFQNNIFLFVVVILFMIDTLADKIPGMDHLLDLVHTIIKPLAGAFLAFLSMKALDVDKSFGLMVIAVAVFSGGAVAFSSHAVKSTTRVLSTKFTAGLGNSIVSGVEDLFTISTTAVILNYPKLSGIIVIVFLIITIMLAPRLFKIVRRTFGKVIDMFTYWLGIQRKTD